MDGDRGHFIFSFQSGTFLTPLDTIDYNRCFVACQEFFCSLYIISREPATLEGVGQDDLAVIAAKPLGVNNPVVAAGNKPVTSGADSVHSQYLHYYYCSDVGIPGEPPGPVSRGTSQPLLTLIQYHTITQIARVFFKF